MEDVLRSHLLTLAHLHGGASGMSLSAIALKALRDNTFFSRLEKKENSFNVRTYDRLVYWLYSNWPDDIIWPNDIPKPDMDVSSTEAT